MSDRNYGIIFFTAILLIIIFLFYQTIKLFIIPMFLAFVFALVLYPVYRFMYKKIKSRNLSALIVVLLFLLILVAPSVFTIGVIATESIKSVDKISEFIQDGDLCEKNSKLCADIKTLGKKIDFVSIAKKMSEFLFQKAAGIAKGIATTLFTIAIMLFCMFFFLRDGDKLVLYLESLIPMEKKNKELIAMKFREVCYATIYGNIITAVIQGIAGGIGFAIFGVSNPVLWGSIMAILALLPFGGTAIIWLPAGIIQIAIGDYFSGIGIIVWGALIVGLIDNFLKPKLIGKKTNLHTLLIFITVVGGLYTFGFVGILLGPIVAALLITFLEIYRLRFVNSSI